MRADMAGEWRDLESEWREIGESMAVVEAFSYGDIAKLPVGVPLPRFASPFHPRRVGSYGENADVLTAGMPIHNGRVQELRPWQRFALDRALECDENGALCWETVIISAPRQCGKSVLERVGVIWRLHASYLFGQIQDVVHIAHNYRTAQEIYLPASRWAIGEFGKHHVRRSAGQEQISLPDGSRWMIQAATDGAGVGFALTMVLVDEAWRVNRQIVEAALFPTLLEANSPQLWLVSTAGTSVSDLMKSYRNAAIEGSENVLILEWSAPEDETLDIGDPNVWKLASPYWDEKREANVTRRFETLIEWDFRQQYLNQWVPALATPLLGADVSRAVETLQPLPSVPVAFGVDVATDRSHACIVAYAGGISEIVDENITERSGVAWVPARIRDLIDKWNPLGVGFDGNGPSASVADNLKLDPDFADQIIMLSGREMCAASAQLFDAIRSGQWSARPNPAMQRALEGAVKRVYGQSWSFARDAPSSGCPLLAASCALWAAAHANLTVESSAIW